MIKIYCDKCGSLIEVEKSTPTRKIRHYSESGHDMCERCYDEFIKAQTKFINDFFEKGGEVEC